MLGGSHNVALIDPLDYPHFIRALSLCASRADRFGRGAGGGARARQAGAGDARHHRAARRRRRRHRQAGRHRRGPHRFRSLHAFSTITPPMRPWRAPTIRSATASAASGSRGSSPNGSPDMTQSVRVLGLGYIGLPTAAVIARTGAQRARRRCPPGVVDTVNSGNIHIEEVDLDALVRGVVARGTLRAATSTEPADVFVIAVPTPFTDDHAPDIAYVLEATRSIAPVLKAGQPGDPRIDLPGRHDRSRCATCLRDARPDLAFPGGDATGRCLRRLLPRARAARPHPRRADRQRPLDRRHHAALRRNARSHSTAASSRGACVTTTARAAEMTKLAENCVPRRQHRLRQRIVGGLRHARSRRVGSDPPRQPPSARQHPAARPRRRRALHRGRPVVHRP